ncbi:hypothetical protein L7F22_035551 [Adiantum nelumboides]|nr:hypothetical protein [Adiantum nelumboides]
MEQRKTAASTDGNLVPACASFFEVADPSTEATHEEPSLAIPKAFVKRFQTYLSQTLVLETPNGEIWKACLEADSEKKLRITSGWKNLAECLNVQSGDLLVFDLVSKGHFQVFIYEGEDMCEKDLYKAKCHEPGHKDMHAKGTTEVIASTKKRKADVMHNCKVCARSSIGNGIGSTDRETCLDNNANTDVGLELIETGNIHTPLANTSHHVQSPQLFIPSPYSSKAKRLMKVCVTLKDLHEVLPILHAKTQSAFKAALSFTSKNPFTIVMMMHSTVCYGFKLGVPRSFAKEHMGANAEHVALIDAENKAWSVTWLGHENSETTFSGGWKHFAMDHRLNCGDICILEKGNTKALPTFKVHILRVDNSDGLVLQQLIPSKISNVIARGWT